jgi:indolepyruvate ferredoxin oxidoreductase beta subunit
MKYQMLIAGFGGQGTVFLIKLISQCASNKGLECLGTENHGMSQRGGSIVCFMKVGNVHSPLVAHAQADLMIGLHHEESLRYTQYMKKSGHMVVNANNDFPTLECKTTTVDVFTKAKNGELPVQATNVFLLGVVLASVADFPFTKNEVITAMKELYPKLASQNIAVLELGINSTKER